MERSKRLEERNYYLTGEHAADYDARTASERSMVRYRETARMVGSYLTRGRVLDIGCGTARLDIVLAGEVPGLSITAADVSSEMVRLAARNVAKAGLGDRIEAIPLSAEELGTLPSRSFDMVMTHGSFSGWLEPELTLAEARRVLRQGGFFLVRDWNRSAPEGLAPYLEQAKGNPARLARVRGAFASSYTDAELRSMLDACGMRRVSFSCEGLWMTAVLREG
jgi:ubiquinone/menaquinone biosynthesis C-methylase UbiE